MNRGPHEVPHLSVRHGRCDRVRAPARRAGVLDAGRRLAVRGGDGIRGGTRCPPQLLVARAVDLARSHGHAPGSHRTDCTVLPDDRRDVNRRESGSDRHRRRAVRLESDRGKYCSRRRKQPRELHRFRSLGLRPCGGGGNRGNLHLTRTGLRLGTTTADHRRVEHLRRGGRTASGHRRRSGPPRAGTEGDTDRRAWRSDSRLARVDIDSRRHSRPRAPSR